MVHVKSTTGRGVIVIFLVTDLAQPVTGFVSVTETVPAGPASQSAVIEFVPCPVKLPPETLHKNVFPVFATLYTFPKSPAQTVAGPEMTGLGVGLTVMLTWSEAVQRVASVIVTVYVMVDEGVATGFAMLVALSPAAGDHR